MAQNYNNVWQQIVETIKLNKKRLKPDLPYGQIIISVRRGKIYKLEIVESILIHTTEEAQKQEDSNHDDKTLSA